MELGLLHVMLRQLIALKGMHMMWRTHILTQRVKEFAVLVIEKKHFDDTTLRRRRNIYDD